MYTSQHKFTSCPVLQFCCIERVIPEDALTAVRQSVLEGRQQLQHVREAEAEVRASLQLPSRFGDFKDTTTGPSMTGQPDVDRLPIPPSELNDIAKQELFAEYLVEPRILRVAKTMLDTHVRIAQTEVFKSRAPDPDQGAFSPKQLQRRGWHSDWPHDLTAYGPTSKRPWMHCGAVAQPFPDVCMALSTVVRRQCWMTRVADVHYVLTYRYI